jgi:hypothetical protein
MFIYLPLLSPGPKSATIAMVLKNSTKKEKALPERLSTRFSDSTSDQCLSRPKAAPLTKSIVALPIRCSI